MLRGFEAATALREGRRLAAEPTDPRLRAGAAQRVLDGRHAPRSSATLSTRI